ncbi:hypothetical protein ACFFTM_09875 [Pseudoduganella plicata]
MTAKCRILNVGSRIAISAKDLPGQPGGVFNWTTNSTKIRLINSVGGTLAVEGIDFGSARDSETIVCTRTGSDGVISTKTVTLTVARVAFFPSKKQKYGFDDFDTPTDYTDDHVSVKSGGETFIRVAILGGAVGTDFSFVCDDSSLCKADEVLEKNAFDLRIKAGTFEKDSTNLHAKVKCPSEDIFASVTIHIYAETVINISVAKVVDRRHKATMLKYPEADYPEVQDRANDWLKEGVVSFKLRSYDGKNEVTDVPYDIDGNGELIYDINKNGGPEFEVINSAMPARADTVRVVVVRSMRSVYYLQSPTYKGQLSVAVRGNHIFLGPMTLRSGETTEEVEVISRTGNIAQLAKPLTAAYPSGSILEFGAAAWASNPIIIAEGELTLEEVKKTIFHEVGHVALNLPDVEDTENIMNHEVGPEDQRLRFCPRKLRYTPGVTQSQWEAIPRRIEQK